MITVNNMFDETKSIPVERLNPGNFFVVADSPHLFYQFICMDTPYNDAEYPTLCRSYPQYTDIHLKRGTKVIPVDVEVNVKGFTKI